MQTDVKATLFAPWVKKDGSVTAMHACLVPNGVLSRPTTCSLIINFLFCLIIEII